MGASGYCRDRVRGERERAGVERRQRRRSEGHGRLSRVAFALAAVLGVAAAGCSGDAKKVAAAPPPPPPEVNYKAIDSPSLQFLPRHQEAAGWRLEEDPIVVPGERIGSYLGNDAINFSRYDVIDVTSGKYSGTASPNFASVEIFRFPDFVKAFGAYSLRKEGPIQFLPLQNEAFMGKHTVHLWRGPFYVRVIGGGAQDSAAALQSLAQFVSERMPAAAAKPAVFNFFPVDTRIPNSERYSAEQGFGQTFLGNSFQATFNVGGEPMYGLIIPASNRATATKILDAYRSLYVRNGKLLDPIPNLGEDNFTAEDKYLGRAVAFRIDRFVIAFNGYRERQRLVDLAIATDARILGSIRKQLVSADEKAEAAGRPPSEKRSTLPEWAQRP